MKKLLSILVCLLVLTTMSAVGFSALATDSDSTSESGISHITKLTSYNVLDTDEYDVIVPENITDIDSNAFMHCRDATSFTLHSGIRHIGENAFNETDFYKDASNWHEGVLYIGTALIKADPEKITSSTYVIRDGTTVIADEAFKDCRKIEAIIVPDSVRFVGKDAFTNTGYYFNLSNWKNDILTLDHILLCANTSLSGRVRINKSINTIADGAFTNCKDITKVITSDSLEHIGNNAFANSGITKIHLGGTLQTLGEGCFNSCHSLEEITLSSENLYLSILDELLYNKDATELLRCPQSVTGTVTLPSSVKTIAADAFESCTSVDEVVLPEKLQSINDSAFSYCGINSIKLPDSLVHIGNFAFSRCFDLKEITVADNVTYLGIQAFEYCQNLKAVTLGNGITSLPSNLFMYCENLSDINLGDNIRHISSSAFRSTALINDSSKYTDGMLILSDRYLIRVASDVTSCTVPDNVRCIASEAFQKPLELGCLKDITLPEYLTQVDNSTFGYSLDGVTLRYKGSTDFFYMISDMDVYDMNIHTSTSDALIGCFVLLLTLCLGFGGTVFYLTICKEESEEKTIGKEDFNETQ